MRPSNQTQAVMLIYYRRAPHNFKRLNENQEEMHLLLTIYYTTISKFQKFAQNTKIVWSSKRSTSQVSDIILDACMQFENYPITTVGEEAFYSYYIYHYFKNSPKIQK